MIINRWTTWLAATAYLASHIYFQDAMKSCSARFNEAITLAAGVLWLISTLVVLRSVGCIMSFASWCLGLGPMVSSFCIARCALVMFSPSVYRCTNLYYLLLFDLVLINTYLFFVAGILVLLVWFVCKVNLDKKRRKAAERELDQVYENIGREDFDVEQFIRKYKAVLDKYGMKERDLAVLKDAYHFTFDESHARKGDGAEVGPCSICLGEFELGEVVVAHPGCGHLFHWECLGPWLVRPEYSCFCPLCKTPTMTTMLRGIKLKKNQRPAQNSDPGHTAVQHREPAAQVLASDQHH